MSPLHRQATVAGKGNSPRVEVFNREGSKCPNRRYIRWGQDALGNKEWQCLAQGDQVFVNDILVFTAEPWNP